MDKYTIAEEAYKRGYVAGVLAEDKWIPVTVAMPEPETPVLCTIYHGEFYTVAIGRVYKSVLSGKMVWIMDYPGNINTVIAWMPLPKAYRIRREEHE